MTKPGDLTIGPPRVDPARGHRSSSDGERRRQVAIFGAGIAGLTAAHELAERGFDVEVFEATPPSAYEAAQGAPCALGGVARTQFARVETPNNRTDGATIETEPIWTEPPVLVSYAGAPPSFAALEDDVRRWWSLTGFDRVVVVGYRATGEQPATLDLDRAEDVAKRLRPNVLPPSASAGKRMGTVTVTEPAGTVRDLKVFFADGSATVTPAMVRALGTVRDLVGDAMRIGNVAPMNVSVQVHAEQDSSELTGTATARAAAMLEVVRDALPAIEARPGGEWAVNPTTTAQTASVRPRIGHVPDLLRFDAGSTVLTAAQAKHLAVLGAHYAATRKHDPKRPVLLVRGFRDASEADGASGDRAAAVAAVLGAGSVSVRTEDGGVAFDGDNTRDAWERRIVTVEVEEDWLPGEHGFRFFPSFYRHVFDTMERIPLLEDTAALSESPRSVIDNLVETTTQGLHALGPDGAPRSAAVPRAPVRSLTRLFDVLRDVLATSGTTLTDTARLMVRLFHYMTSSSARRAAEYEHLSWSEFIGPDAFSDAFARLLETAPLSLVGLRSREADARTFGNVTVQLLIDQLMDRPRTDATMNAPTTVGWFLPWRRYLEAQGVVFRHAKLTALRSVDVEVPASSSATGAVDERHVWAEIRVEPTDVDPGSPETLLRDYFVVALPAPEATALVKASSLSSWGDGEALVNGLDVKNPRPPGPGRGPVDSLGADLVHLSGVQFYFDADLRCIDGHALYLDAPWRLSAISQPQFWDQQRGWWDGYRGLLSVDVADWITPLTPLGSDVAWDSTAGEIAQRVWRQIAERVPDARRSALPVPIAFHLDDHIVLDGASGRPTWNATPLLLTRVGRYPLRPGRLDPAHPMRGYAVYGATTGPAVAHGKVVMAGTHMQTHTRLTTMEAANESARHAVNGILEVEGFRGARCRIWNIEDPETLDLPDLRYLVDLDERLHARGLPHVAEILDLDTVPPSLLSAP